MIFYLFKSLLKPTGQRESNHYISKLKRLMDYNYPKEVAEVALRKHNFHFESALGELYIMPS